MSDQETSRAARRNDYSVLKDGNGRHFILVARDLKNTRDLRTMLLDAAYELQAQPDLADAQIILHSCALAKKRVAKEVEQFKSITHKQIAQRIQHIDNRQKETSEHSRKPTTATQEAVMAYLLQRHIQSLPGVSIATIAAETKASLPTVYKAIKTYGHCIDRDPDDKTLRLRNFAQGDWITWIQRTTRLSSAYFIDRSGSPRNATRLAKDLARLQRDDIAVGGLMGALHHMPGLDATIAPQLDILVHGTPNSDLSFIRKIDPGLERTNDSTNASVVVHFIDRPASLFVRQDNQNWGALPDCIANMYKAGLHHQVIDAMQLIQQGRKK